MPADLIFHEGNAFAFHGACENHERFGFAAFGNHAGFFEGAQNLIHVVAVDVDDVPTEGAPLVN